MLVYTFWKKCYQPFLQLKISVSIDLLVLVYTYPVHEVIEVESEVLEMEIEPTVESLVKNIEVQATPHKRNVCIQARPKPLTRSQIAAHHFNHNGSREQAVVQKGELRYEIIYPKFKKGGYKVRKKTIQPTYRSIITLSHVYSTCFYQYVYIKGWGT